MREDVAGALGAGEQVLAVVGVEEFAERLDAADDHQEIVLAFEREHGIDEIVPRALLAELDLQAVGEEGKEIIDQRIEMRDAIPAPRRTMQFGEPVLPEPPRDPARQSPAIELS